jgi:hypothetical protein
MSSLAALQLRPYRRLLAAYTVNAAGDWIGEIALSVLILERTRSVLAVSALWILGRRQPTGHVLDRRPWSPSRPGVQRSRPTEGCLV